MRTDQPDAYYFEDAHLLSNVLLSQTDLENVLRAALRPRKMTCTVSAMRQVSFSLYTWRRFRISLFNSAASDLILSLMQLHYYFQAQEDDTDNDLTYNPEFSDDTDLDSDEVINTS